jgi:hypothetical protein
MMCQTGGFSMKKWWWLDSTLLLNSALKLVTLYWQIVVFSRRIATEKISIQRIALVRGPNLRAESQSPEPPAGFVLGLRAGPRGGWQSAVQMRADCQAVILIVANCGIGARKLAIQWNPAPAIFHLEAFLFEASYIFDTRLYKFKTNTRRIV